MLKQKISDSKTKLQKKHLGKKYKNVYAFLKRTFTKGFTKAKALPPYRPDWQQLVFGAQDAVPILPLH